MNQVRHFGVFLAASPVSDGFTPDFLLEVHLWSSKASLTPLQVLGTLQEPDPRCLSSRSSPEAPARGPFVLCMCCLWVSFPHPFYALGFFSSPLPFSLLPSALIAALVGSREEPAKRGELWAERVKSFLAPEQQFSNRSIHLNERNHSPSHLILKFHILCFHFRTELLFFFPLY